MLAIVQGRDPKTGKQRVQLYNEDDHFDYLFIYGSRVVHQTAKSAVPVSNPASLTVEDHIRDIVYCVK